MNANEPVAYVNPIWMDRPDLVMSHQLEIGKLFARTQFTNYVPLYNHPAKTLTDGEIWEVINRTAWVGTEEEIRFKIAEAILRKAQEK